MALFSRSVVLLLVLASPVWTSGAPMLLKTVQVSEEDVGMSLRAQLKKQLPATTPASPETDAEREQLQRRLETMFTALPKGQNGTLGHASVRYALHRLFVQHHGWFIRGLEPHSSHTANTEEWVPEYLQALIERREQELGENGTNLSELMVLAASLEDLVAREAAKRMRAAWQMHALPENEEVTASQLRDVVETFYVAFLNGGNFVANSPWQVAIKKQQFAEKYVGWPEAQDFLNKTLASLFQSGPNSLAAAQQAVPRIGQSYHSLNDKECKDLKSTLRDMEAHQAGRVRLPTFYKKSLYSHWRFDERVDYLRALGALDESDPKQPKVITVNYVMARNNCLEASGLYAICCRNECEDLMGMLESQIASPDAEPELVAKLVGNLLSDTVDQPRNISGSLLQRLQQVALANGGKVPLHGRLFAQWMHHAFPRECPYPHQAGSINPQTPDEWMRATGQVETSATAREMQAEVDRDTCAVDAAGQVVNDCGDHNVELPWNEDEELLVSSPPTHQPLPKVMSEAVFAEEDGSSARSEEQKGLALFHLEQKVIFLGLLVVGYLAVYVLGWRRLPQYPTSVLAYITALAWVVGLLDSTIFVCAALGGLISILVRKAAVCSALARCRANAAPVEPKCLV